MIYVDNDRIYIHISNGEQNEKFRFIKSSWVNTALNNNTYIVSYKRMVLSKRDLGI